MTDKKIAVPLRLLHIFHEKLDPHRDALVWGEVCALLSAPACEERAPLPEWAEAHNDHRAVVVGAQLQTRNGAIMGNACILRIDWLEGVGATYTCRTDAGNVFRHSLSELKERFTVGPYILAASELQEVAPPAPRVPAPMYCSCIGLCDQRHLASDEVSPQCKAVHAGASGELRPLRVAPPVLADIPEQRPGKLTSLRMGGVEYPVIDWTKLSELGVLKRINEEVCHPLGLAIFRDDATGVSAGAMCGHFHFRQDAAPGCTKPGCIPFCDCDSADGPPVVKVVVDIAEELRAGAATTDNCELLRARVEKLEAALWIVADWKLPSTGETWPSGAPVHYTTKYGSNGARDYMRQLAVDALKE